MPGAWSTIQRFGGVLTLNIHFHMLFLDGVYDVRMPDRPRFVPVPVPTAAEMTALVQLISERVVRHLEMLTVSTLCSARSSSSIGRLPFSSPGDAGYR